MAQIEGVTLHVKKDGVVYDCKVYDDIADVGEFYWEVGYKGQKGYIACTDDKTGAAYQTYGTPLSIAKSGKELWVLTEPLLAVTLTIVATPSDAVVTINGVVTDSVTVNVGESVEWSVSCDGYITQSGTWTASGDETLEITLLSEWLNVVTEGGAAGDGSTDDAAVIQAAAAEALASGRKLYFPAGRYMISNYIRISVETKGDGDESLIHCEDGGEVFITAYAHDLSFDGSNYRYVYGTAENCTFSGTCHVYNGGTAENCTFSGTCHVYNGGTAENCTFSGACHVYNGGTVEGCTLDDTSRLYFDADSSSTACAKVHNCGMPTPFSVRSGARYIIWDDITDVPAEGYGKMTGYPPTGYTLASYVQSNGTLGYSANEDWIRIDSTTNVTTATTKYYLTVSANDDSERTGTINVTATFDDGTTDIVQLNVTQAGA